MQRLVRWIQRPLPTVRVEELQKLWQHDDIVLICKRPPDLEDLPDLAQRIRGAVGNELQMLSDVEPVRPDPFGRETAYELLYEWSNPLLVTPFGTREIAVPLIVRAQIIGSQLIVTFRLFGAAAIHINLVECAARIALESGVSLKSRFVQSSSGKPSPNRPNYISIQILDTYWKRFDGAAHNWLNHASEAVIQINSPIIIRSGKYIRLEPEAIMHSALRRTAAIAPWMGFSLAANSAKLTEAVRRCGYELSINPEKGKRFSKREPHKVKEAYSYGGKIKIRRLSSRLLPYLQLATLLHVGGECASGFGAIDLYAYP